MKLYVGMKIWKNGNKRGYYVIRSFDDQRAVLSELDKESFECSVDLLLSHIQEYGTVSTWRIGYGA